MSVTLSSTTEDYLKQLYLAEHAEGSGEPGAGGRLVPTGRLATALGVTPGTATVMVQSLAEAGLVAYEPRRGARLSAEGTREALRVIRRHRLIELFLVDVLGMDWGDVHPEAERLEHAVSDAVLDRIDALLGQPEVDPHGDPIPTADGDLPTRALRRLGECEAGATVRIERVADQAREFLVFAHEHGLVPGTTLHVEARDRVADSITIRPEGGAPVVIGGAAARRILVG